MKKSKIETFKTVDPEGNLEKKILDLVMDLTQVTKVFVKLNYDNQLTSESFSVTTNAAVAYVAITMENLIDKMSKSEEIKDYIASTKKLMDHYFKKMGKNED